MTDQLNEIREVVPITPIQLCADHDDECPDVKCKTTCWLYQPERGRCPYLESQDD